MNRHNHAIRPTGISRAPSRGKGRHRGKGKGEDVSGIPVGNRTGAAGRQSRRSEHQSGAAQAVHARASQGLLFCEVAGAVKTIRESTGLPSTRLAFEFLVLTAARSGEVRLAEWREIDLDGAVWTIPAARMKAGREHRIPLSAAALAALEEARNLADSSGLVFPSQRGKPMTDSTISKMVRENGIQAVPHGFRSSFRDWCAEHNIDRQVAESALAHVVGNATEAAYLRSEMFELRRRAMVDWGAYVSTQMK